MISDDVAIKVENLTKIYKLYNSPADRLKEALSPIRRKYHHDFHALHDVSLEVQKGDSLGIIGKNGSGKSTLLKTITGVLTPSFGKMIVNGKVSALLELGAGFNPELTGIENIYFNGILTGYSRDEMDARLEDIIAFADIGEFIHQPVKIYSSGMFVRLAFAVGISVSPDIMIIDEALSVGDVRFQQKCMGRIQEFKDAGGTLIFVSHDMNAIRQLCGTVVLMDSGSVKEMGDPVKVVDIYQAMLFQEHYTDQPELQLNVNSGIGRDAIEINTGEAVLLSTKLYNDRGEETNYVVSECDMKIEFTLKVFRDMDDPHYGFHIRNKYGISVFDTNSYCMGLKTEYLKANQVVVINITLNCNIPAADYTLSFGFGNKGYARGLFYEGICWNHNLLTFTVLENKDSIVYSGHTNLKPCMEFSYV